MKNLYLTFLAMLCSLASFAVLPITGPGSVCVGSTITLTDATPGGSWTSSGSIIAVVGSASGIVTGTSPGTETITYTVGGIYATTTITVLPVPPPIGGISSVCMGSTTLLSDGVTGGTWTTSSTAICSINPITGVLTGAMPGSATITYSLGSGCATTRIANVMPIPTPIGGPSHVCFGATITLTDAIGGGTWTTASTVVTISGAGVVTGISAGTTTVTYSLLSGCATSTNVTVDPAPSLISGPSAVCVGGTMVLSDAGGGTWASSSSATATIGITTGIVSGMASGTVTITYTIGSGCIATDVITSTTGGGTISGASAFCVGAASPLTDTYTGGTWMSSNTAAVTVGYTTGVMTGLMTGSSTITYSVGGSCTATYPVTVTAAPGPITGLSSFCDGTVTTLTDATPGGTWTSSITVVAVVGSSGTVVGIAAGTTTITYSLTGGCYATQMVTVNPFPGTISGSSTICASTLTTLSDLSVGGTWTSTNTAVATVGSLTGIVTGISGGTAAISYTFATGCGTLKTVTVNPSPTSILGAFSVCTGTTPTLSDAISGGTWSSTNTLAATIGLSSGILSALTAGTTTISYTTFTGCSITQTVTVDLTPSAISATLPVCNGNTETISDASAGGTWSSDNTAVATIDIATGVATSVSGGTTIISYVLPGGCSASTTLTVNALPTISATSSSGCGDVYTLTAGGGVSYSWVPSSGLSCSTCATTTIRPSATTTFTVTGTDASGCSDAGTVTVNGNRISGFITFSSFTPDTLDMKVWLIQFDPTDSSITALDSMNTCYVDSVTYYEFDGKPAGTYMVKARMTYEPLPGASGYIPTYGLSTPNWYSAATVAHAGASDSIHINMVYGTVPPGPGFISGYVYSGAGKGTSGDIPVEGMLIYLEDKTGKVLTSIYTKSDGSYTFSGLAYSDYIIYPEDYDYNTTPPNVITLSAVNPSFNAVDFKQYLTSRKILPYTPPNYVPIVVSHRGISIYPNPASHYLNIQWQDQAQGDANVVITDVIGREVYKSVLNINTASGQTQINIEGLKDGIYQVTVKSDKIYYSGKLVIQ